MKRVIVQPVKQITCTNSQIVWLVEDRLDKQHETVIWLCKGQQEEVGFLWDETRMYYSGPPLGTVWPVGHP
jgi:hypothetical protein